MKLVLLLTLALVGTTKATNDTRAANCQSCNDGKKVAGGTGCHCGADGVAVADDEFCYVPSGTGNFNDTAKNGFKLTATLCDNTDGTVAATAACKCSVNSAGAEVAVASGEFCFIKPNGNGVKYATKRCTAAQSDGDTAISGGACLCGLDKAATDNTAAAGASVADTKKCIVHPNGKGIFINDTKSQKACTTAESDGRTALQAADTNNLGGCYCGDNGVLAAAAKFCYKNSTTGLGIEYDAKRCTAAQSDGDTAISGGACLCGLDKAASDVTADAGASVADTKHCYVGSGGKGNFIDSTTAPKPATTCPHPVSVSPAGVAAPGVVATLLAAVAVALRM